MPRLPEWILGTAGISTEVKSEFTCYALLAAAALITWDASKDAAYYKVYNGTNRIIAYDTKATVPLEVGVNGIRITSVAFDGLEGKPTATLIVTNRTIAAVSILEVADDIKGPWKTEDSATNRILWATNRQFLRLRVEIRP